MGQTIAEKILSRHNLAHEPVRAGLPQLARQRYLAETAASQKLLPP